MKTLLKVLLRLLLKIVIISCIIWFATILVYQYNNNTKNATETINQQVSESMSTYLTSHFENVKIVSLTLIKVNENVYEGFADITDNGVSERKSVKVSIDIDTGGVIWELGASS
jgi:hypothetical protein